jgi:hypothetical protein
MECLHPRNAAGCLRCHPVPSCHAEATRQSSASPQSLPMNEMLTGVPSALNPLGT